MPNDRETELKRVKVTSKPRSQRLRRDPNLTGGSRAETPAEKASRKKRPSRRPQPYNPTPARINRPIVALVDSLQSRFAECELPPDDLASSQR